MYNMNDWNGGMSRNSPVGVHCIHMRGLPFKATEMDIAEVLITEITIVTTV